MRGIRREVAIFLKTYNQMKRGLAEAEGDLSAFTKRGNKILGGLGKGGAAAFGAMSAASVMVGANFEQSIANVGSMMTGSASDAAELEGWMGQLTDRARELGSTTKFSASESSDAMYALASGGMEVNQIIAASEGVLKLAGATMSDMGSTAELTMSSMRQFKLEAADTNQIVNIYGAAIQNSMLTQQRLTDSMKYAGPIAASLGMSLEETAASMAIMHNAGLMGTQAGTGFRMMMTKLMSPTANLQKMLGDVSIETDGLAAVLGKLEGSGASVEEVFDLTATQLNEMFGPRAFGAMKAMLDGGSAGFDEMVTAVTGTNAAFDMYAVQMDTTASRAAILKSSMEDAAIGIFTAMQDQVDGALTGVTQAVNDNKDQVAAFFGAVWKIIGQGIQIVGNIIKGIGAAFSNLYGVLKPVLGLLVMVFNLLRSNGPIIAVVVQYLVTFAGAVLLITNAITIATKAQAMWNAVQAASPMTWLVLGIAAVVTGIVALSKHVGGWGNLWQWTMYYARVGIDAVGDAWNWVSGEFKKGWEKIKFVMNLLKISIQSPTDAFVIYGKIVSRIFVGIWNVIKKFVSMAGKAMMNLGKMLLKPWKAKDLWNELKGSMKDGFGEIIDEFEDIGTDAAAALVNGHDEEIAKLAASTAATIEEIDRQTQAAMSDGVDGPNLVTQVEIVVDDVVVPDELDPLDLTGLELDMPLVGEDINLGIADAAETEVEIANGFINDLGDVGKSGFGDMWDGISDTSKEGGEKFAAVMDSMKNSLWSAAGSMVQRWLWKEITTTAATVVSEVEKTAAVATGTAARIPMIAAEDAANSISTMSRLRNAAAGFFSAFSPLGPFAIPAALASIGVMYKVMKEVGSMAFYEGGIVGGPHGRDKVNAWVTRGEYVMPTGPTQQWLPLLESMRAGSFSGAGSVPVPVHAAAAGSGSAPTVVQLIVPEGSLIVADDRMAVDRFAEKLGPAIDRFKSLTSEG